jgi:hypothetical protein
MQPLRRLRGPWFFAISFLLAASVVEGAPEPNHEQRVRLARTRVPFVENRGQLDPRVAYSARTFFGTVFVTRDGRLVYSLPSVRSGRVNAGHPSVSGWTLAETLLSGHPGPSGGTRSSVGVSDFHGSDPNRWQTNLPTFDEVLLGEVWKGVSVFLRAHGGNIEKVFTVGPGARVEAIRLRVDGARSLRLDREGALVAATGNGDVRFSPPLAYQERDGVRHPIAAAYVLAGKRRYGFRLEEYDPMQPVVIDPLLQSTYIGGTGGAGIVNSLTVRASSGEVVAAGYTFAADFPATSSGAQPASAGSADAFVARLDPTLTSFLGATYLGGSGFEEIRSMKIDPTTGDVLVGGATDSTDFPVTAGGAQPSPGGGGDGFLARLDPTLTALLQASYLGGSGGDAIRSIAIHPTSGEILAAGGTDSTDFPGTTAGAQPASGGGGSDGFLARLDPTLTSLLQSTHVGGSDADGVDSLAVHSDTGEVFAAGWTRSTNLPGTTGGAQPVSGGHEDCFVARFNSTLTELVQATYLGGSNGEYILGSSSIAIHPSNGEVLVAGIAQGPDFPGTTGGAQPDYRGMGDMFVARLDSKLTTLLQSTFLGGSGEEYPYAVSVDPASGRILVAGSTSSVDFAGTRNGVQPAPGGGFALGHGGDGFMAGLNSSLTGLLQATYLGGVDVDEILSAAVQPSTGEVLVAGFTLSNDFPGTAGGAKPWPTDGGDGFVARLTADLAAPPNRSFYTLTPCRLVDTRAAEAPALAAGAERVFTPGGKCGIPPTAQALSVNVTVTQPTAPGHVRIYPAGSARPLVSTSNYGAGQTRANNAILNLGDGGALRVYCGQATGTVHLVVDVNGYFQ